MGVCVCVCVCKRERERERGEMVYKEYHDVRQCRNRLYDMITEKQKGKKRSVLRRGYPF